MKGFILVLSLFSALQVQAADVAVCVDDQNHSAISYNENGNLYYAILDGTGVSHQPKLVAKGAEAVQITHGQLGLPENSNESLFQYPLPLGRHLVIAWTVDPHAPDQITEGFRPSVIRIQLLASDNSEITRYTRCRNYP